MVHLFGVVADETTKTEIEGYVCPACRLLFAADLSHVGKSVSCPGCGQVMRIPLVGEETETIEVSRSRRYGQAGGKVEAVMPSTPGGGRRQAWDRPEAGDEDEVERHALPWMWIVPAGLLGMGMVGAMVWMVASTKTVAPEELAPVVKRENEEVKPKEVVVEAKEEFSEAKHGKILEEVVKKLTGAGSVEEVLPLIRKTPGVEEKVKGYYASRGFGGKKFRGVRVLSTLIDRPAVATFEVQYEDFSVRNGYAEVRDGKVLIDWETFVVYSGLPWDEIAEKKPTEAVEIWAVALPSSYYNFGFKDAEWQAYELISPEEERSFIGYAKRNGSEQARLRTFGDASGGVQCVLKIRYPEGAVASNQVEIVEVVKNNWQMEEEEK